MASEVGKAFDSWTGHHLSMFSVHVPCDGRGECGNGVSARCQVLLAAELRARKQP